MITLDGINLGENLQWIDEFGSYERVGQHQFRTLGGVSVLQNQGYSLGRPITLQSSESTGWLSRQIVEQLQSISETSNHTMILTIGVRTFTVQFRHIESPAFEAVPLGDLYAIDGFDDQYFIVTIKLITI